jgi:glycine hydroxymethyltransferase
MIMTNDEEISKKINRLIFPGIQGGPLMHTIAGKAVAFKEALSEDFREYQEQVIKNAHVFAESLEAKGYRIVSGGTDNHLMLVDLTPKDITGKVAEKVLGIAGITVNKNGIPYDTQKPFVTSGIRIGTPAITTRGMKEQEMEQIVDFIDRALISRDDEGKLLEIKKEVETLCKKFPIYL